MKTNCIIICAGEQSRWNNYLNEKKQLIKIDGERLLDRTIRLIKNNFDEVEINVVALCDEYSNENSKLFIPELNSENYGFDKFLSSRKLWKENERNIIFYGDVYFTNNAMKIISISEKKDWFLFGRYNCSYLTGKGGECFAFSFYDNHFEKFEKAINELLELHKNGSDSAFGGWNLYRHLEGIKYDEHLMANHFVEINDLTDDFDYPEDYDNWINHYNILKDIQ